MAKLKTKQLLLPNQTQVTLQKTSSYSLLTLQLALNLKHATNFMYKYTFGSSKLGRLLGRGAFAKVYFAQSVVDGSSVAIKVINKLKIRNTSMEPRIIREISAMHRLDHPNIIRIHEVMATKTKIYIVMEYAKGGELFSEIASQGQLTESLARQYFQQLVSALHFCHINGVTHRDIKPQNLLLDCEGNLKISDFGLSALTEQSKDGLLRTACGTPAYTAPEVIGQDSYEGTKSDAWSCGIILFVLLAGFTPFDDSNIVVMYRKIMRMEFEFPSWFSKPVRSVISRLLDPNYNTRMTIEELMEDDWFTTDFENEIVESGLKSKMIPMTMNAFDIISMSSGMDLSAIFQGKNKQERRFTSTSSPQEIVEKIQETGRKLGYNTEASKGEAIELGKGNSKLSVDVLEVVDSSLFLVKLKVVGGALGDGYWGDWKAGLEEIFSSWHKDVA